MNGEKNTRKPHSRNLPELRAVSTAIGSHPMGRTCPKAKYVQLDTFNAQMDRARPRKSVGVAIGWVYRHVVQFPTRTLLNSYNPQLVQFSTRTILKSYNPQLVQSSSRPWSTRTTCTNKRNVLHFIVILLNINIITSTANVGSFINAVGV